MREGGSLDLFEALAGLLPPERCASCFKEARRVTFQFTRSADMFSYGRTGIHRAYKGFMDSFTFRQPLHAVTRASALRRQPF